MNKKNENPHHFLLDKFSYTQLPHSILKKSVISFNEANNYWVLYTISLVPKFHSLFPALNLECLTYLLITISGQQRCDKMSWYKT
jgi:hypothetical protein